MIKDIFLSVVVTAFNEEKSAQVCITRLSDFLKNNLSRYEILFVNDGSTDDTKEKLNEMSGIDHLKIIHLDKNQGTGGAIKVALKDALGDWYCWFPSDLEILPEELLIPLLKCPDLDIVITYFTNGHMVRTKFRNILSRSFTKFMGLLFGRNLKYFNGISLIKMNLVKNLNLHSNRFFFHAELLLKVLRKSERYAEVPLTLTPRHADKSKAIRLKVLGDVLFCVARCFWEIRIKNENPNY